MAACRWLLSSITKAVSGLTLSLQDGSSPPSLGTELTPLVKGGSRAGQSLHRYAVQRQCSYRGLDTTSSNVSENLACFLGGRG